MILSNLSSASAIRYSLEAALIKSQMGESWYSQHCKIAVVTSVRVSARIGAAA